MVRTTKPAPDVERLYTAHEVAELLQVNVATVRRWINDGHLATVKLGDRSRIGFRISRTQLQHFLDARS